MFEQEETNAKAGAWTEAAKLEFLLRIIAVYKDNKPMPWSRINMPGRTQKSLQNQWTKIQKDIAALADGDPETALKATPRKRGKKSVGIENGDDDDEGTATKKKGMWLGYKSLDNLAYGSIARTPTKAKGKAAKKEIKDEGLTDDEEILIKKDEDSDMD
ncbi:uncharacterized protein J7T54_006785 [Emericellopsis cladophorae]|uniref:Myb-like domain-containing protein n=1 Tax=Emericellopsis cladophorae TaxID=2686198 RepID=A0A9P9Y7N3_9HYPO|nr:uncharacterized protein J7T54_006785 [Emericellopsis cladophorae]KAI6785143.1 hypothetical protein J7T54_006785 [Emericellopsis cladophorae]